MLRFPVGSRNLNRIATLAILPLIAFGVVLAMQAGAEDAPVAAEEFEPAGMLVVANLVSQDLTIHNLRTGTSVTLALPGAPHEMVEVGGRLYVTLDRADRIVEVDPRAPGILRMLFVEGRPHGIATDGTQLFITLDDADEVVTVDIAALEVRDRQPTGNTPHAIAVTNSAIFVTDSRDNAVRRIAADGTVQSAAAGELPESIVILGELVITGDADSNQLSVFDRESLEQRDAIEMPGRPVRIAVQGEFLLVARNHDATLEVLSLPGFEPVASAPVADFPDGICADPGGRYVGVASNGEGLVTVLSAKTWEPLGAVTAGRGPGTCLWMD